ncbi:MAG: hypothetical protein JJV97_04110 [SAR324 cluster bacterium]|nr:hypothetical protein [SAR324 cluster bacterium]
MGAVVVGGLKKSGKTTLIKHLLDWSNQCSDLSAWGAFKPFDCSLSTKNKLDLYSDGEIFSKIIKNNPHSSIINPYLMYPDSPFDYATVQSLVKIDLKKLSQLYKKLTTSYNNNIWIESFDLWHAPIKDDLCWLDWSKKITNRALWIMTPEKELFNMNLSQIILMRDNFSVASVILNNHSANRDHHWLQYCWEKIELCYNVQVLGIYQKIGEDKVASNKKIVKNIYEHY